MVEGDPFSPSGFIMAFLTSLAELPLMRVMLFVAGDACLAGFVAMKISLMARIALGFGVLAA